jgi:hypothetical protein
MSRTMWEEVESDTVACDWWGDDRDPPLRIRFKIQYLKLLACSSVQYSVNRAFQPVGSGSDGFIFLKAVHSGRHV